MYTAVHATPTLSDQSRAVLETILVLEPQADDLVQWGDLVDVLAADGITAGAAAVAVDDLQGAGLVHANRLGIEVLATR